MKIQKIEIEAFGGLHNYTLALGKGFQYLYGENEAGKSTLCAFLSAMLFGFSKGKKGERDERKLYMPWGENKMGGTLYFSFEGKEYILNRKFGRTAKGDTCSLRLAEDWQEIAIAPEEIGEHFLGVGQEAFRKTLYISQLGVAFEKGKEDEILTKLSNLEHAGDEEVFLQKALSELERAQFELVTKTGRGGILTQLDAEIEALQEELSSAQQKRLSFQELLEEIQLLAKECNQFAEQKTALLEQREAAKLYEQFLERESLRKKRKELETQERAADATHKELCAALQEAEKQAEEWKQMADLGASVLVDLAKKEAAMQAAALEREAFKKLAAETEQLEAETKEAIGGGHAKKTMLVWGLVITVLALAIGFLVNPLCFALLLPGVGLTAVYAAGSSKRKEAREQRERLSVQLAERKEQLAKLAQSNPQERYDALQTEIHAVLQRAGVDSISALSEKIEKTAGQKAAIEALQKDIKRAEENLVLIKEALANMPVQEEEETLSYSGPNQEELTKVLDNLQQRQMESEKRLAQKKALYENGFTGQKSVAAIEAEIADRKEKREDLAFSHQAVSLARELLSDCAEELKGNFAPALNEKTGALIEKLTDGRYLGAKVTDDYTMMLQTKEGSEFVDSAFVSGGTCDLIYFALRLALIKTLFEKPPLLIMDDTFIQFDQKRQLAAFTVLAEEQDVQILYFSCHEPAFDKGLCEYRVL